jgi:fibronectin-binding autotransporter adhesin
MADLTQVDITANRTVTLDVSRTVGSLSIGDTNGTHSYTLDAAAGAALTFSYSTFGFNGVLAQSATSAGDTIAAPILIGNVNYLSIQNASAAAFTISGNISSAAGGQLVQFERTGTGSGLFNVTGVISDGASGNIVRVGVVGNSTVTLTGANTYTGGTSIVGSTLYINGDNSAATGSISVNNAGSLLGGTGVTGGGVNIGGGGTITGATDSTVGTFTIGSATSPRNLTFNPGEASAAYLANLGGTMSDLLNISGTLSIIGNSHLHFVGSPDGTSSYTLATYSMETGHFIVDNLPAGYSLLYLPTELDLIPTAIPEPATWVGGALGFGAVAFVSRRRLRRALL